MVRWTKAGSRADFRLVAVQLSYFSIILTPKHLPAVISHLATKLRANHGKIDKSRRSRSLLNVESRTVSSDPT
jgi:hypothetical protein